jgi:hypothetical protein
VGQLRPSSRSGEETAARWREGGKEGRLTGGGESKAAVVLKKTMSNDVSLGPPFNAAETWLSSV